MKNRHKFFIYFIFLLIFTFDTSISNDFELDSKLIEFDNEGKIITATGEVEINVENGIIIKSDKSILNKQDSILEASGNVYFYDEKNKIEIFSENIKYEKKKNITALNTILKNNFLSPNQAKKYNIKIAMDGVKRSCLEIMGQRKVNMAKIRQAFNDIPQFPSSIESQVETDAHYMGYLERQEKDIESFKKMSQLLYRMV